VSGGPLLRVDALSFSYPRRHVFTDWSADFGGGINWVRGSNGSGKSTLLKLLGGALPAAAGSVVLGAVDSAAQPLDYRRQVFWCGPGAVPFEHLTPAEYFGFMHGLYPRFDAAALERHVRGFALAPQLHAALGTLSTGTQRKTWLAAALAAGCRATLLDEPINALDAASHAHLLAVLAEAAADRSRCWIVASHESLGDAGAHAAVFDLG